MKVFCVRHHQTLNFLPAEWRSSSWWEGEKGKAPRLFMSEKAAKSFVVQWARGRAIKIMERGRMFSGEDDIERIEVEDLGRTRDMLEIVPMTLVEER